MENQTQKNNWLEVGTPRCGIVFGLVGVLVAVLLMVIGFWKTLFIAVMFAAGFVLGAINHKTAFIKSFINRLFPPKGE